MSLFEMIPERPMIMPTGSHAARSEANKMFGLREKRCAYCGGTFYRRIGERDYIRRKNKKELVFCTWSHACRWEEENKEREKPKKKGPKKKPTQERVDYLMQRMIGIRTMLDSEAGQAMSKEDRNRQRSRLRWHAHEIRRLMGEMGDEAGQSV